MFGLLGQRGQAMMMALLIMGVGMVVTAALVTMGTGAIKITRAHHDDIRAYYIAEAGAERGLAMFSFQPSWTGFDGPQAYGGGEYEILSVSNTGSIADGTKAISFASVGRYGDSQKSIECTFGIEHVDTEMILPGLSFGNSATWQGAGQISSDIFVDGNLTVGMSAASTIEGNIKARGNVTIKNPSNVLGHVHATGTVTTYSGEAGGFDRLGDQPLDDFSVQPLNSIEYYKNIAGEGRIYPSGQVWDFSNPGIDVPAQPLSGVYVVEGDVRLRGTYTGRALIVAHNITVPNARDLLAQNRDIDVLTLITYNSVSLGGNQTVDALILSDGDLNCSGTTFIYGAARARVYNPSGTPKFYYREQMYENTVGGIHTTVTSEQWKEKHGVF